MNQLEKTIDDAIKYWSKKMNQHDRHQEPLDEFIVLKLLTKDAEFESALYQIVTEKLNKNG